MTSLAEYAASALNRINSSPFAQNLATAAINNLSSEYGKIRDRAIKNSEDNSTRFKTVCVAHIVFQVLWPMLAGPTVTGLVIAATFVSLSLVFLYDNKSTHEQLVDVFKTPSKIVEIGLKAKVISDKNGTEFAEDFAHTFATEITKYTLLDKYIVPRFVKYHYQYKSLSKLFQ